MAAKGGQSGLILSSSPYLRSVRGRFPLDKSLEEEKQETTRSLRKNAKIMTPSIGAALLIDFGVT